MGFLNQISTMPKPSNPHDKLFKAAFSDREVVQEFIRNGLPEKLGDGIVIDSLSQKPVSYISPTLSDFYSDIVYTCSYGEANISIALLFEHKSYVPTYPHVQLLRYIIEAWDKMLSQDEPLQLVIPIIVYHGDRKWSYRDLSDYFDFIPADLKKFLPSFDYILSDLNKWPEEYFNKSNESILHPVIRLLKYIKDKAYLRSHFVEIFETLEPFVQKDNKYNLAISLFVYLSQGSGLGSEEIIELSSQLPPNINRLAMTAYEQFVKKGEELGKIEEKNQVIKKGFLKGLNLELLAELTSLEVSEVKKRLKTMEML